MNTSKEKQHYDYLLEEVKNGNIDFLDLPRQLKNNKEFLLSFIDLTPHDLSELVFNLSDNLASDKDFILKLIRKKTHCFPYASNELRDNYEVVVASIEENPSSLIYASERLKNDERVLLIAYEKDNRAVSNFPSDLLKKIDGKNIRTYLEAAILEKELNQELSNSNIQNKKLKL